MITIPELIERAEAYCKRNNIALATLSTKIANDGKWLGKLKSGEAGCTMKRIQKVEAALADLPEREAA